MHGELKAVGCGAPLAERSFVRPEGGPAHCTFGQSPVSRRSQSPRIVEAETDLSIRVLVADDQEIVRTGLSVMLNAQPDIEVVGMAANGLEAVAQAQALRPDVCLMDVRMPELDGVEATRRIAGPDVESPIAVVVITTFDHDDHVFGALRAGARGFLLKDAGAEMLVQAIRAAANGEALISPRVTARLLSNFVRVEDGGARPDPIEPLTNREEEVLRAVARGLTNNEISDELHISLSTTKAHIASIMQKIDARNRVEIVIWAYETARVRP